MNSIAPFVTFFAGIIIAALLEARSLARRRREVRAMIAEIRGRALT
jgi:hypothetical protein